MPGKSVPVTVAVSTALGQSRCDDDLLKVLGTWEQLHPVVLSRWTDVEKMRRSPTLADAVRMLRSRQAEADAQLMADAQSAAMVEAVQGTDGIPAVTTRDITVEGAAGPLPARVYTPTGGRDQRLPVVLYFHGGGGVLGSIDADEECARGIAAHADAIVLSVGYRLAPEHRFPAAWDDALAAWHWLQDHAALLHADGGRIALAGEGLGATLALATAIALRDRKLPAPKHVLAVCPVAQTHTNTPSYLEQALARPLSRAMMVWMFERLVSGPTDLRDPRLELVSADLTGLPPVTIHSAQFDPLRSDAERLHEALARAGVPVEWQHFPGMTHGFFCTAAVVAQARQAHLHAGQRLAAALAAPTPPPPRGRSWRELASSLVQLVPGLGSARRQALEGWGAAAAATPPRS